MITSIRTIEFGRVGILVDLDLLNCRCRECTVHLDSIHNQGHTAGPQRAAVQEPRHCSNVILIEYRQVIERLLIDRDDVAILTRVRTDATVLVDCDFLIEILDRKNNPDWSRRARSSRNFRGPSLKTFSLRTDFIISRLDPVKAEGAGRVGYRCPLQSSVLQQRNLSSGQYRFGLVLYDSRNG